MVSGLTLSGFAISHAPIHPDTFLASFLGLLGFFALLRLMDERKDYEKDCLAHPERPLPRGLLDLNHVTKVIIGGSLAMVIYGCLVGLIFSRAAGILYLIVSAHLWLMYREFYCGPKLEKHPILYAMTHQAILIWLCAYAVTVPNASFATSRVTYDFGLLIVGAFFTYEVCRKLDPNAHPILKTYRSLYGVLGCLGLVLACEFVAGWAAYQFELHKILWPCQALVIASFVLLGRANGHRRVELVASLSLLMHMWALAGQEWFL